MRPESCQPRESTELGADPSVLRAKAPAISNSAVEGRVCVKRDRGLVEGAAGVDQLMEGVVLGERERADRPTMRRNGSEMGSSPDVSRSAVGQARPVAEQEGGSL